ncbi:MAG: helix-turn-helix transcriptional regulator [Bacillota bacterium]|nr:helix-turn-helix transcriptional regulator [Bacillota bacterium]
MFRVWLPKIRRKKPDHGKRSVFRSWGLSYVIILTLPMVASLVIFANAHALIRNQIISADRVALDTIKESLDEKLQNANQITTSIMIDSRFKNFTSISNNEQDIVEKQQDLISLIYNYRVSTTATDILIYIPALDYCVSTTTAQELALLHNAIIHYKYADISLDAWREALTLPIRFSGFHYSKILAYDAYGEQSIVYCTSNVPTLLNASHDTSLFISVQLDDLKPRLPIHEGSAAVILDQSGTIIMSYGEKLTGQAIDLDRSASEYDSVVLSGIEYVFSSLNSEIGAFTYAILTPKSQFWSSSNSSMIFAAIVLIITTVIGIFTLFYLLNKNYMPIKNTINLITKDAPADVSKKDAAKKDKNEFDVIYNQLLQLYNTNDSLTSDFAKQQHLLRDNYLNTLLKGGKKFLSDDDMMETLRLDFSNKILLPVSIFMANPQENLIAEKDSSKNLLPFLITNVLGELLDNAYEYYKTDDNNAVICIFALKDNEYSDFDGTIEEKLNFLCTFFENNFKLKLYCIVGTPVYDIDHLAVVYRDVVTAYAYQYASNEKRVMRLNSLGYSFDPIFLQYDEYISLITEAVARKNIADAHDITNKLFALMGRSTKPFRIQQYHIFSLVNLLQRNQCNELNPTVNSLIDKVISSQNLVALREATSNLIQSVCYDSDKDLVRDAVSVRIRAIVDKNFSDVNLSLVTIADEVGLSAKYVSKIFKMETGQGLLDYINSVRIQKAKDLMSHGQLTINELAERTGYTNVKTFRRAFHKIEGINPGQYRI